MKIPSDEKIDQPTLQKYLEQYGVATAKQLSAAMKRSATTVSRCSTCQGDSDMSLPECPWCGDAEEFKPEEESGDNQEESMANSKKKTSKKVAKKAAKKVAPVAASAGAKVGKKKKTKRTATKAPPARPMDGEGGDEEESVPVKPSKAPKAKIEVVQTSSQELRAATKRVHDWQRKGIECMWELGRELQTIYESKLYTQLTVNGKPLYNDWTSFCRKELKMDPHYGLKLMEVAKHFEKGVIHEIGVTKLTLLVRVPEEQRAALMEKAKNTTSSKLAAEVRDMTKDLPPRKVEGRSGRGGGGASRRNHTPSTKLTIVRTEPRVVIDLFKRGTNERAQSIDDAVGLEQCGNGMEVHYAFMITEEGISLAVETRRED